MDTDKMKYFCIGVYRSGTTSVREYLGSLGLRSVDWSVIANNHRNYPHNMGPIYETLDNYEVFGDIPYNYMQFIQEMIVKYPDALFFLSMREESTWMESILRHRASRIEGVSNLITKETLGHAGVTGSSDMELQESYLARNAKVVQMFREAGQEHRLCSFNIEDSCMKSIIDEFLIGNGLVLKEGAESFPWAERTK